VRIKLGDLFQFPTKAEGHAGTDILTHLSHGLSALVFQQVRLRTTETVLHGAIEVLESVQNELLNNDPGRAIIVPRVGSGKALVHVVAVTPNGRNDGSPVHNWDFYGFISPWWRGANHERYEFRINTHGGSDNLSRVTYTFALHISAKVCDSNDDKAELVKDAVLWISMLLNLFGKVSKSHWAVSLLVDSAETLGTLSQ
jgi:hypothetical protein